VRAGQHVDRGTLLGYSGNTGTSAACHLHFEVYVNGATTNPRPLLGL
jgi:murein DD-endopeptidase MepM/ murein hydrolase activator NlpD